MTTIRMAVGQVQGVVKVTGDAAHRTIDVVYDPATVNPESIEEALENVGYDSSRDE